MNATSPARLVVLVSGHGSNLQAILDACRQGRLNARVTAVFSNKTNAYGLERARQAGAAAIAIPKARDLDRRDYDALLRDQVADYQPDWVILAGWMRILSAVFLERFAGKVVNLHPALPGMFPGTNAIERAYEAYQQGHIRHKTVPINPGEALAALEDRVHAVEHELLINVLQSLTGQGAVSGTLR